MKQTSILNRILDTLIPRRRLIALGRELEAIKADILSDGKIDFDETSRLLEIIEPYARLGDENAVKLRKLLLEVREDGKIDTLESELVIGLLDLISVRFARLESGR